ncbi:MAG: Gfo/Idh/MocA family oxidoreductase [Chloroflexi bacterium]|nr:Gfo/Idh/MocA family oxidoreductase [Chloroflexota bacterium]
MAGKLRVGVIGSGGMTQNHSRGYLNTGSYEIVALADLSPDVMDEYDEVFSEYDDYKAKHFTDFREMLRSAKPEIVSIGVWHGGHAPMTVAAAAAGGVKAILCEKPMADSLGAAATMLMVCKRHNVKLIIGHQRRFLPAYTLAKQMIEDGEIGEVRLITSVAGDGLPNYASHQTDMFRYLLGDVECTWVMGNVERETDHWERATRIEDRALAVFGFENDAQAMIVSDLTPVRWQGARIYGSEGMINMTTDDLFLMNGKTAGWAHYKPDGEFFKYGSDRFEWVEGGAGQARELADWVTGRTDYHRGNGDNGYKALEMVHAVYESARLHVQVELPMKTMVNPLDVMIDSGHLQVRYPGKHDIRAGRLRGENLGADSDNQ